jgi:hypothetical protein
VVGTAENNGVVTIAPGTIDQALEGFYASGSKVDKITFTTGNNLFCWSDIEDSIADQNWTKRKEIQVNFSGIIRVKFDFYAYSYNHFVYARIYKNGVPVGTTREEGRYGSGSYTTYSEDIAVEVGDKIQLYGYCVDTYGKDRYFRLYKGMVSDGNILLG